MQDNMPESTGNKTENTEGGTECQSEAKDKRPTKTPSNVQPRSEAIFSLVVHQAQ
jgi:hypothetical protein